MLTLQFIITALVIIIIPGTGAIYTISIGITHKYKKSIFAALGCTLGIIPHLAACIFGLSAIMNMSAKVFTVIKLMGSIYLFYLAIKTWIYAGKTDFAIESKKESKIEIVKKAIVINLLNPKLTIFFLSFLPQFIPQNTDNPAGSMAFFSFVFMILTFIVFCIYGLLASYIRELILSSKKIMKSIERGFAVIFGFLAVELAFSDK